MLVLLTFILFFSVQIMLLTLFPYSGTSYLVSIPLSIILTSLVLLVYYWLADKSLFVEKYATVFGSIALIAMLLVNLEVHKPEGEPSSRAQIMAYISVYSNYDKLDCSQLQNPEPDRNEHRLEGLAQEYVALLYKCQFQIPYNGSFAVYNRTDISRYILKNRNEIQSKLDSPSERYFYSILNSRKAPDRSP